MSGHFFYLNFGIAKFCKSFKCQCATFQCAMLVGNLKLLLLFVVVGLVSVGHSTYLEDSAFIFLVLMLNLQRLIHDSQRLTHGSHGSLMVHIGSLMARSGSIRLTAAHSISRRVSQELVHGSQWLMYGSRRLTAWLMAAEP